MLKLNLILNFIALICVKGKIKHMDAPLSDKVRKILKDREATKKLMKAAIAGARNGYSEKIEIEGKKYKISTAKKVEESGKADNE